MISYICSLSIALNAIHNVLLLHMYFFLYDHVLVSFLFPKARRLSFPSSCSSLSLFIMTVTSTPEYSKYIESIKCMSEYMSCFDVMDMDARSNAMSSLHRILYQSMTRVKIQKKSFRAIFNSFVRRRRIIHYL